MNRGSRDLTFDKENSLCLKTRFKTCFHRLYFCSSCKQNHDANFFYNSVQMSNVWITSPATIILCISMIYMICCAYRTLQPQQICWNCGDVFPHRAVIKHSTGFWGKWGYVSPNSHRWHYRLFYPKCFKWLVPSCILSMVQLNCASRVTASRSTMHGSASSKANCYWSELLAAHFFLNADLFQSVYSFLWH